MFKLNKFSIKKKNILLFFLLITVIVFWASNLIDFKKLIKTEIQQFQSHFNTFSSPVQLFDKGDETYFSGISKDDYANFFNNLFNVLLSGNNNSDSEVKKDIKIFIKFKHLEKIYSDREVALQKFISVNPREVPCKISDGINVYKCKVRLKGDLQDHWDTKTRMSLRIEVKDGYIHGLKNFAIQKPSTRTFPYDQTFHEINSELGRLTSDLQEFMNVSVNGHAWGVMNIEPIVDDKFIEIRGLKRSGIFRISNQDSWAYTRKNSYYPGYFLSDDTVNLSQRGKEIEIFKDPISLEIFSHIQKSLIEQRGEIFHRESMVGNFMLSLVWGYLHPLDNSNSWYTWNSYEHKLEPIPTDQGLWSSTKELIQDLDSLPNEYKNLYKFSALKLDEFNSQLDMIESYFLDKPPVDIANNIKAKYFQNDSLFDRSPINENINYLRSNSKLVIDKINRISKEETKNLSTEEELYLPLGFISSTINKKQIEMIDNFVKIFHFQDGMIQIFNLLDQEVFVKKISYRGESIDIDKTISPSKRGKLNFIELKTEFKGDLSNQISIETLYKNFKKVTKNQYSLINVQNNDYEDISICSKISATDECVISEDLIINKTVVIKKKSIIEPGVSILLSNKSDLIFENSVSILGEKENQINISGDQSGGIFIKNKDGYKSILEYVNFSNLAETSSYLRKYTGAVNGYGGIFILKNVSLKNNNAEDQLNIINSSIDISFLDIRGARSDAFDCDFCFGNISNLNFKNVGGDGLDISGSILNVENLLASNVKDKAISIGENSKAYIDAAEISQVATGIAVKDSSYTVASNISLEDIQYDAFMTYVKKPYFLGKTSLIVTDWNINQNIKGYVCVRENNTFLSIDGIDCEFSDIDVDKLYEGRMKKNGSQQ